MVLNRGGVVRSVGHVPHRGRATHRYAHPQLHPHRKMVWLKITCLGCSNLRCTSLLNCHYHVLLHPLSRRCGFLLGLLSHLRIALRLTSALRVRYLPSFLLLVLLYQFFSCLRLLRWVLWRGTFDSSSASVLIWCCRTRKRRRIRHLSPEASGEAANRTRVERAERGAHVGYIQRHN